MKYFRVLNYKIIKEKRDDMNQDILKRKGARKAADIPKDVLDLLNQGLIESVNLTEWLAIDQMKLVENCFPSIGLEEINTEIKSKVESLKKKTTVSVMKTTGEVVYNYASKKNQIDKIFKQLSTHLSDTIRSYSCYLIALDKNLNISEKLNKAKFLAADKHFGVREVIWLALRPELDKNLKEVIEILTQWAKNEDENIRRFATEAIRPRGVWCKHIDSLKTNPEQALEILEALKADESKYVQDSVGNWLNDASKSKPDFVDKLCQDWQQNSPTKTTLRIIKKARRTLDK